MTSVYALCGGLIDLDLSGFFCDKAPGLRATVPVICFLIAHPQGNVLVDTGVHRQALTDPVGRLGEGRASRFTLRSSPTDEVMPMTSAFSARRSSGSKAAISAWLAKTLIL